MAAAWHFNCRHPNHSKPCHFLRLLLFTLKEIITTEGYAHACKFSGRTFTSRVEKLVSTTHRESNDIPLATEHRGSWSPFSLQTRYIG
jgi:hypothetical protein